MHRYGIEEEVWFEAARTGLERRGFKLRIQPRSIILEKDGRLPRIVASARELLEFAERQGLRVEPDSYTEADRYGDRHSDLKGRATESPFETPLEVEMAAPARRFESAFPRRPEVSAPVESRLAELRQESDKQTSERRVIQTLAMENQLLQTRCSGLEQQIADFREQVTELEGRLAEHASLRESMLAESEKLLKLLAEAEKQRDIYQMTMAATEERLRGVQAEYESMPISRAMDKRFDQLRRFLARELHPDLVAAGTPERELREALFKRVWAKIEQLQ